jgi:acetyl-CoA acyltransferase
MKPEAFVCDAIRTPIGRYGGALAKVRTDDLAAIPIRALMQRNPNIDWEQISDVILGCANQAGEDNRNVARMASLLAGIPSSVASVTINRLCGSGLDAIGTAARAIKSGEAQLIIAGGIESMTRAPYVMLKSETPFARSNSFSDSTIGWRFVNNDMKDKYGIDSMPETAENLASQFKISREEQDRWALRSQLCALAAQADGHHAREITPVLIPQKGANPICVDADEHPRHTSLEILSSLGPITHSQGTITAGNASGINDGACALLVANEKSAINNGLTPKARIVGMAVAGVEPRFMGIGPVPASEKVLALTGLKMSQMDVVEINEAFAAQTLAVMRGLGLKNDDPKINSWGGGIALGHPLGASGARLVTTAINRLHYSQKRFALCTMCIGVGQGISVILERV